MITQTNSTHARTTNSASLIKHMLIGAVIGLAVILNFVIGAHGKPEWGSLWMIRPLIVCPLAGAGAGLFFYVLSGARAQGGWKKALAIAVGAVVYVVAIWMGIVLGLAGTMWD